MMKKNTLVCDQLTIIRNNRTLIKNLSISLMPGSLILLDGENGLGKTSLLEVLARLDKNNSGSIYYNNCLVDDYPEEYNKIILYLSDKDGLESLMTVSQTLDFWAELYDSYIIIPAAVRTFNLEEVLDLEIVYLSKGMKKRLVLARLLLQRRRIWLLDEPFTYLDSNSCIILANLMTSHVGQGGIIIYSDHLREEKTKTVAEDEKMGYKMTDTSKLDKKFLKIKDFHPNYQDKKPNKVI